MKKFIASVLVASTIYCLMVFWITDGVLLSPGEKSFICILYALLCIVTPLAVADINNWFKED